jgi:hypothetical protein
MVFKLSAEEEVADMITTLCKSQKSLTLVKANSGFGVITTSNKLTQREERWKLNEIKLIEEKWRRKKS